MYKSSIDGLLMVIMNDLFMIYPWISNLSIYPHFSIYLLVYLPNSSIINIYGSIYESKRRVFPNIFYSPSVYLSNSPFAFPSSIPPDPSLSLLSLSVAHLGCFVPATTSVLHLAISLVYIFDSIVILHWFSTFLSPKWRRRRLSPLLTLKTWRM